MNKKAIVIGFDGVTWDLLDKFIDKGIMPNLGRAKKNGQWGYLKSTIPPLTPTAWASFATGVNPAKHGCFDFVRPDRDLDDYIPMTSEDISVEPFYEYAHKLGKKMIVVNMPLSYPPRIPEIMVTSLLTAGDECVFPTSLVEEYPKFRDYQITPDVPKERGGKEHAENMRRLEKTRFEISKQLFKDKEWDFYFILFSALDWIQHERFTDLMDMDSPPEYLLGLYRDIDSYYGWFLDNRPKDVPVILMSDHGFEKKKGVFFINSWLARKGLLSFNKKERKATPWGKIGESYDKEKTRSFSINPLSLLDKLLKYPFVFRTAKFFYDQVKRFIPIQVQQDVGLNVIGTKFFYISKSVYANWKDKFDNGMLEKEEGQKELQKLKEELRNLKGPSGLPVYSDVYEPSEVYWGDQLKYAPDLILHSENFLRKHIQGPDFIKGKYQDHGMNGVFLYSKGEGGEDIKVEDGELLEIIDLAPTILEVLGLKVPEHMDGNNLFVERNKS